MASAPLAQYQAAIERWRLSDSMRALVEPRVRAVVAAHLAVDHGLLADAISMRDDLAADSLDLLELTLLLEQEFGIALSDRAVDGMRSYGDVVDGIARLVGTGCAAGSRTELADVRIRARLGAYADVSC